MSKAAERSNKRTEMLSLSRAERISFTIHNKMVSVLCPTRRLAETVKGVAGAVFLEMGKKFVENDFFKDFGQKWKVRNGAVVLQQIFVNLWPFQQRLDKGSLQITWYNTSGKR